MKSTSFRSCVSDLVTSSRFFALLFFESEKQLMSTIVCKLRSTFLRLVNGGKKNCICNRNYFQTGCIRHSSFVLLEVDLQASMHMSLL
ncbi:unnamed protein product [Oikopleura dioica]|uniref:Uncharacterized protein n=1 Tax=Oikopleura dioica TaxID=34765 RepID=E4YC79_OIKDI|nr:unnamed protein product [Oikopleura dioica]